MTIDELKAEFTKYLEDNAEYSSKELVHIWLDCAEPIEKRIIELEEKNKALQEENLKLESMVRALKIEQNYCIPNCSKVTELEKLKQQIESYAKGTKDNGVVWHVLEKNPDDLPVGEVFYYFDQNPNLKGRKVYGRSIGYYDHFQKAWKGYYQGCPCKINNVIAWSEIPDWRGIPK